MSKVCVYLTRFSLGRAVFTNRGCLNLSYRPCGTRMLSVTSQLQAKSKKPLNEDDDDENKASKPIKFSTSKASHRTWNVGRTMGSNFQRPWWKVLPLSVFGAGFLLWCVFRGEGDIDKSLEKSLYEHLPDMVSDEEVAVHNKPS